MPLTQIINNLPQYHILNTLFTLQGLDLIDRVPDELWTEVRDIAQQTGSKTILKGKKNAKKQNGCLKRPYK